MASIVASIVGLVVAVIVVTNVAIPIIKGTNQTGWTTTETSIFGNVSVMIILGLFMLAAFFIAPM